MVQQLLVKRTYVRTAFMMYMPIYIVVHQIIIILRSVWKLNLWSYTTVNYFEHALDTVIFRYILSSVKIVDITKLYL